MLPCYSRSVDASCPSDCSSVCGLTSLPITMPFWPNRCRRRRLPFRVSSALPYFTPHPARLISAGEPFLMEPCHCPSCLIGQKRPGTCAVLRDRGFPVEKLGIEHPSHHPPSNQEALGSATLHHQTTGGPLDEPDEAAGETTGCTRGFRAQYRTSHPLSHPCRSEGFFICTCISSSACVRLLSRPALLLWLSGHKTVDYKSRGSYNTVSSPDSLSYEVCTAKLPMKRCW